MFAAILTPILFSLSAICAHRSARLIGGTEANFWRITAAAIFLGAWAFSKGQGLGGVGLPVFLLSGVFGIGIGDVAFFQALPRLGSRLSLLLIECLSAPFGGLIEWLWLGTALTAAQFISGLIILAGVGLALSPSEHLGHNRGQLVAGTAFSVVSAIGMAMGAVLSRKAYELATQSGETVETGTAAFQRVLGGLALAGIGLVLVKARIMRIQQRAPHEIVVQTALHKWKGVWWWIVLNSLFGQTLGVTCMQQALKTIPTGIVLAIIAVTPILVIPLSYFFEGERPTKRSLLGGFVAVGGVLALIFSAH